LDNCTLNIQLLLRRIADDSPWRLALPRLREDFMNFDVFLSDRMSSPQRKRNASVNWEYAHRCWSCIVICS